MEDIESLSSSLHDLAMTPTHTSIPDSESSADVASEQPSITPKTGPPFSRATFIICDPQSGLVITLRDGELRMLSTEVLVRYLLYGGHCDDNGSHWRCVENKSRWLGFKNTISGQFIGNDHRWGDWRFRVNGIRQGDSQYFCTRHHRSGGYEMLVKVDDSLRAMKVGGPDKMELVVAEEGERGTLWEFHEVKPQ